MHIKTTLDKFYYELTIYELNMMNKRGFSNKITYNSLLYLDIINYKLNCTVSYLAEILHIAKSAVTLKVKDLEKLGVIEKIQSQKDKRTFYLHLKPEAAEIFKEYDNCYYKAIKVVEESYSKSEIDNFCEILNVFSKHFCSERSGENEQPVS